MLPALHKALRGLASQKKFTSTQHSLVGFPLVRYSANHVRRDWSVGRQQISTTRNQRSCRRRPRLFSFTLVTLTSCSSRDFCSMTSLSSTCFLTSRLGLTIQTFPTSPLRDVHAMSNVAQYGLQALGMRLRDLSRSVTGPSSTL